MKPTAIQRELDKILPLVKKPGRYTGGELNQVVKVWENTTTRLALLFPEVYDLGMSNLGWMVLYMMINQRPDLLAERAFLPWTDMIEAMRNAQIPLYSLETKHALTDFDIIGVSLPYESIYTNFLTALDLANIPMYSRRREEDQPLIIAGGHATFNPEPVAPFIDAFVIGEGEEVILEITDAFQKWKRSDALKNSLLQSLNTINGVYVPSLYRPIYNQDETFSHFEKQIPSAKDRIQKRIAAKLPPPPTNLIVPYIDIVHNRAPVEIMRGCTRGCRFCHAGFVNRPVRERPVQEIVDSMEKIVSQTGFSEIGLLSLSSSDYTNIVELVKAAQSAFVEKHIAISLPSLRIESISDSLIDALAEKRRSGFTLAPEAGTARLRNLINKPISDQQILETAQEIFKREWHTIKLYFMIGFPSELMSDIKAIADLSKAVRDVGEKVIGRRAKVHASVSTFVPKPHTPFQWVPCLEEAQIQEKIDYLQEELRGWGLKLNWNDPQNTIHEAWLSRGDRRMAEVIRRVYEKDGKFDAWQEHFDFQIWLDAFQETGLDPAFYAHRQRSLDERFPWDHIDIGVQKSFLQEDYKWSKEGKTRPDCREQCYACGVLSAYNQPRRMHPGEHWMCPEVRSS